MTMFLPSPRVPEKTVASRTILSADTSTPILTFPHLFNSTSMFVFHPKCTLPTEDQGFVANPNVRSTMDIVENCLATLVLCCWSILHLNVPPQFRPKTRSQKLYRGLWMFWRKLK